MLRVVLADDEKKVLLLMCKLIDWESLPFVKSKCTKKQKYFL